MKSVLSVGYEDPTFFRRLFKRKAGLTPACRVPQEIHRHSNRGKADRRSKMSAPSSEGR